MKVKEKDQEHEDDDDPDLLQVCDSMRKTTKMIPKPLPGKIRNMLPMNGK